MKAASPFILLAAAALAWPALAQPDLADLWPNADGQRWTFTYTETPHVGAAFTSPAVLQLEGTTQTAGGPAQILLAWHDAPPATRAGEPAGLAAFERAVWRARPDLRRALELRRNKTPAANTWDPLLLHDGYFMKGAANIRMWQPDWNHPTWTYLTSDLQVGATFTHQLIPELASDIYLHGTVEAVDDAVTTPAGTFTNAVRVAYLIDLGVSWAVDEMGGIIGSVHGEIRGHVRYVPDFGPVELLEEHLPCVWIDCGPNECPPSWVELEGQVEVTRTLELTEAPTPVEPRSWGGVKALYR